MASQPNPFISFRGGAREVTNVHHMVLSVPGGELISGIFAEFHASEDPGGAEVAMHGRLTTDGHRWSSTHPGAWVHNRKQFFCLIQREDEAEQRGYWVQLSDGGMVTMPLENAAWVDASGICADKDGVSLLINNSAGTEAVLQCRNEQLACIHRRCNRFSRALEAMGNCQKSRDTQVLFLPCNGLSGTKSTIVYEAILQAQVVDYVAAEESVHCSSGVTSQ